MIAGLSATNWCWVTAFGCAFGIAVAAIWFGGVHRDQNERDTGLDLREAQLDNRDERLTAAEQALQCDRRRLADRVRRHIASRSRALRMEESMRVWAGELARRERDLEVGATTTTVSPSTDGGC